MVWGLPRYSDLSLPLQTFSVIVRKVCMLLQLLSNLCMEEKPARGHSSGGVAVCESGDKQFYQTDSGTVGPPL